MIANGLSPGFCHRCCTFNFHQFFCSFCEYHKSTVMADEEENLTKNKSQTSLPADMLLQLNHRTHKIKRVVTVT